MAVTATPIFPQSFQNKGITFVNSDGTTKKTVFTAGANGSKLEAMWIQNLDPSVTNVLTIYLNDGTTDFSLSGHTIGFTGNGYGNFLTGDISGFSTRLPQDVNGNRYMYLTAGWSIKVGFSTAVASTYTVTIITAGEDF